MKQSMITADYIFETSWEVCNKVGGIYTVLSTQARTLQQSHKDHIIYIGPDLWKGKTNATFLEDTELLADWRTKATEANIPVRAGRWNIPGKPVVFLVDYTPLFKVKNEVYGKMWADFGVDSIHAYGDYDESCMFSLGAAKLAECICNHFLSPTDRVVFQAHEWMSGCGMLYIRKHCPQVGTVFTTHATSIGRSITTNDKPLYDYFKGYDGDQMSRELHMESKHSVEKQAALHADCLTTVSEATDKECLQFFGRKSDVILMNGFENDFVPKGAAFTAKRAQARQVILNVANKLMGTHLDERTVILSTSGRNDFRCKGFDVLIDAFAKMQRRAIDREALAIIAVPCWKKGPREDLQARLRSDVTDNAPLPSPYLTHDLYNIDEDRIVATMRNCHLTTDPENHFHVMLVPSYLDGNDGILNLNYYDWLTGCDFCLYPSYYEPWGYTCQESISFGIPCLTTDLAGFGQWVNRQVGHGSTLEDGVAVIHRTDSNYGETSEDIVENIIEYLSLDKRHISSINRKAKALAGKALWKDFIKNYYAAYGVALEKASHRHPYSQIIISDEH